MKINTIQKLYFLGIGGIGMSALARYFLKKGCCVSGYDKTCTPLTEELEREGMDIHYVDDPSLIPKDLDLVIYTPAIPQDLAERQFLLNSAVPVMKRSAVLGILSENMFCIAVAGTHGKTTTTSMIAHLLKVGGIQLTAFMGGISKNYQSNLVLDTESQVFLVEADEFDRSFLTLSPSVAVLTSTDADHLDIYESHQNLLDAFQQFLSGVVGDGIKIIQKQALLSLHDSGTTLYYSAGEKADVSIDELRIERSQYSFTYQGPGIEISNLQLLVPGRHNVENALAAITVALQMGVSPEKIALGLQTYTGVKRRFDYRVNRENIIYIDDYAHHPEEIRAFLSAVKELYPEKKLTALFQPHLFSRTRDHLDAFASVLSQPDQIVLLDIYPARELPIDGISSQVLLNKIQSDQKTLLQKEAVIPWVSTHHPEVFVTIGAGDIDQLIEPLTDYFNRI